MNVDSQLEYDVSLTVLQRKVLQATVWSYDPLQENEFLGGFDYPLESFSAESEVSEWFPLGLPPR